MLGGLGGVLCRLCPHLDWSLHGQLTVASLQPLSVGPWTVISPEIIQSPSATFQIKLHREGQQLACPLSFHHVGNHTHSASLVYRGLLQMCRLILLHGI